MKKFLLYLFTLEKSPKKGLLVYEWVVMGYLVFTLALVLAQHSLLPNVDSMIKGRVSIAAITLAMWGVYRLVPCGFTYTARAVVQMSLLSWWYPDIFDLNRLMPNLDHLFAGWEQALFGCQPALLFSQVASHGVISELMCLGYYSYYPMMALVCLAVLYMHHESFERVIFIVIGTFFIHYIIFIFLPVVGPQFYYQAVGTEEIAKGVFPNLHDYFNHRQDRMACPGYADGVFYHLVEQAHQAGERPVAAFPSSHVSVCTVLMMITWHYGLRRLFWALVPIAVLLFLSTVYIRAHYAIDALAGLVSGALCWLLLAGVSRRLEGKAVAKSNRRKRAAR